MNPIYNDINKNNQTVETKARRLMVNQQRAQRNRQQTILSRSAAEMGLGGNITE